MSQPSKDSEEEKPTKKVRLGPKNEEDATKHKRRPELYANKLILAPMVRANSLPFRLICLRNGADLVYSEELIDHRIVTCKRIVNEALNTVDLVDKDGRVIFRTCPEERNKLVFQIGSNDPERALRAAKMICNDVIGIDFNFGCPKRFSIAGGMGAALLEQPERIKALLTHCVKNLDIPVTCKMRILPDFDATLKLVKLIESCGVSAIAVHGRTKEQRPSNDNNIEFLRLIAENISIPLIANGESNNIKTFHDIKEFQAKTKASSVMVARAAMKDPAIFRSSLTESDKASDLNGSEQVSTVDERSRLNRTAEEYVKLAVIYDNHPSNVKYSLQSLLSNGNYGKELISKLHSVKSLEKICDIFGLSEWYEKNKMIS